MRRAKLTKGQLPDAGYDHSVREGDKPISDHSIVWVSLSPGGEQMNDHLGDDV